MAQTTACLGPRPVANALGCAAGEIATVGIGSPARSGRRRIMAKNSGACGLGDDLGLGRPEGELVAEPVRTAHHHERDHEAEHQRPGAAAAEDPGDGDDQTAEAREQDGGLHRVLEHREIRLPTAFPGQQPRCRSLAALARSHRWAARLSSRYRRRGERFRADRPPQRAACDRRRCRARARRDSRTASRRAPRPPSTPPTRSGVTSRRS